MLEYIFLHPTPRDRFVAFVTELGLPAETSEADDGLLVLLPEDLGEDLDQRIEDFYDQLLDMTEEILALDEPGAGQASGVTVTLEDGRTVYARVPPRVAQPDPYGSDAQRARRARQRRRRCGGAAGRAASLSARLMPGSKRLASAKTLAA